MNFESLQSLYGKQLIIYGLGMLGKMIISYLLQDDSVKVLGVCTSDAQDSGTWEWNGIQFSIRSIQEWKRTSPNAAVFIAAQKKHQEVIIENCQRAGFREIIVPEKELTDAACDYEYMRIYELYKRGLEYSERVGASLS